jgi:hypothetical protein
MSFVCKVCGYKWSRIVKSVQYETLYIDGKGETTVQVKRPTRQCRRCFTNEKGT